MEPLIEVFRLLGLALRAPGFWYLLLSVMAEWTLTFLLQRWWLGRQPIEVRERAWNSLTWGAAILWTGALSMIPFAWVTREHPGPLRGVLALVSGILATGVVYGTLAVFGQVLAWLLGVEIEL